jgi:predicted nucleic acid-binding Zn ribbon protein
MPEGPQRLSEILSRLFTERGWGRKQDRLRLERAWAAVADAAWVAQTRVVGIKRGVLEIEVAGGVVLQELAQFHKRRLLGELQRQLTGVKLNDLRFRAGTIQGERRGEPGA